MAENDSIYFVVFVCLFLKLSAVPKNPTLVTLQEEKLCQKNKVAERAFYFNTIQIRFMFAICVFSFYIRTNRQVFGEFSGCAGF